MKEEGICMAIDMILGMEGGQGEVEGYHDPSIN